MIDSYFKNAKILIVDDKESNIDILEDLLEESGYLNYTSTSDSRQTLGLFKSFNPDLILLDLMMPHLSGHDVMAELSKIIPLNSYLPILVLTADISPETKLRALSEGAKDFLSKPFDLYELRLRIKNLLETRYLHQLLENQNQILEEKVKERTLDLELSNKDLVIARDKAQESDRLKTAFLNNISHEIRTPLNGMLGSVNFIVQSDLTPEEKEDFQQVLESSSERLMETVSNYVDMSLIISGTMAVDTKSVDYASVIQILYDKYRNRCAKKNLELKVMSPAQPQIVDFKTDEELLINILSHILNNSVKFTNNGIISLGCDLKNDYLEFYIKDTGVGISKDAQQNILEAFRQEDYSRARVQEGSGLGLSIALGMTDLLGGKIRIESEKHQGTSVFVSFPV